jgi:hypothetical protein
MSDTDPSNRDDPRPRALIWQPDQTDSMPRSIVGGVIQVDDHDDRAIVIVNGEDRVWAVYVRLPWWEDFAADLGSHDRVRFPRRVHPARQRACKRRLVDDRIEIVRPDE